MSEPLESLTQQLIRRATEPFGLAILTGVTSSSFLFFGALVLTMDGTIPATITASERAKKGISDTSALKMWDWVFHRARVSQGLISLPSLFRLEELNLFVGPLTPVFAETFHRSWIAERCLLLGGFGLAPRPATHLARGGFLLIHTPTVHARTM